MTGLVLWDGLRAMVSTPEFWPGIGLWVVVIWATREFGKLDKK